MTNTDRLMQIKSTYDLCDMEIAEILDLPYTLIDSWFFKKGDPRRKRPTSSDIINLERGVKYKSYKKPTP